VQSPSHIHRYLPAFLELPTQEIPLLDGSRLPAPWRGLGLIEFDLLFWLIGIVYLLPKEVALSCWVFYFVGLLENVGAVMACQLEGLKLADAGGLRGRRVGGALALAATLAAPLAIVWTLHTFYSNGFESLHMARRSTSMVGTQIHHAYAIIVEQHDAPTGPQWGGILAIGVGVLITIALSTLRTQLPWFPLHPIGYLAANSWGMHINWASFFLGWLIKVLVTRYGGLKVYNRLLPFFLGLLAGDALSNALWGLMAWLTGTER